MITVNNFHNLQLNRTFGEPKVNVPQVKSVNIIAKLRWTIRLFNTHTSKKYYFCLLVFIVFSLRIVIKERGGGGGVVIDTGIIKSMVIFVTMLG